MVGDHVIFEDSNPVVTTPRIGLEVPGDEANEKSPAAPFFIVGLGRSGSTLLSRMLDANSAIAVFPETWCYVILDRLGCLQNFNGPVEYQLFLNQVWDNLRFYNDPAARVWAQEAAKQPSYVGPTATILNTFGRAYAQDKGARIWGEKTPGHVLWLPQIHDLFPNAKIIVTVRDPRDVLVSYDDRWGGGRRETAFLMNTAALVRYYLRRCFDDPGFPPDRVFIVRYEELTSRPLPLLKAICQFLEVDFQPSMVDFYEHSENWIATDEAKHHALLKKPATNARVGRYRTALTLEQIWSVEGFLADEMKVLDYPPHQDSAGDVKQKIDTDAVALAQRQYEQMQAGVFRRKFRKRGKLILLSYKNLGKILSHLPVKRVARTAEEWREKAKSALALEEDQPVRSMGPTPDEQILGLEATAASVESLPASRVEPAPDGSSAEFRQHIGTISRHSAVFFAGTLFTGVAGYLFKIYLARVMGAEALGLYALGMTIIAFLGIFNGLGLSQSAVRFVALYSATGQKNQLRGFLVRTLAFLLCTNILLAAGVMLAGPWVAEHIYHTVELNRYFWLFSLIMLLGALTSYAGQVLQGYKDVTRRIVITNFIGSPLVICLTIGCLVLGWGLWGYLFAQVLSAASVVVLLFAAAGKLTPPEVFRQRGPLPPLGKQVVSFGVAALGLSILEFLLGQTDKILLGFYLNPREVGIYAVAMAVVAFVPIGLQSVNQIFSPTIADLDARGERELLGRLFQTLTKWIFGFTLPLAIAVVTFAEPLMRIFGSDFAKGWPVLVIGTMGQLANAGTGSVGFLLFMSGNQNRLVKIQATMTAMSVLLNVLLIPRWGIVGAVVAVAIANAGTNVWNLLQVRSSLGLSPYNRSYLILLPAGIATAVVEFVLLRLGHGMHPNPLFILISIAVGYLAFLGTMVAIGLDKNDRLVADAVRTRLRGGLERFGVSF
jgi:O-antigen/teichoic acid export membrane protein